MSSAPLNSRDLRRTAELVSALDSELRLSILLLLDTGDRVVHEMVAELGKSQPLISQHLRVLKSVGFVTSRRTGREVVYSLAQPAIVDIIFRLAAISATDELDRKRIDAMIGQRGQAPSAAASGAAIIGPPASVRPEIDPGLSPRTPKPKRD